jgi:hypothetical protein
MDATEWFFSVENVFGWLDKKLVFGEVSGRLGVEKPPTLNFLIIFKYSRCQ